MLLSLVAIGCARSERSEEAATVNAPFFIRGVRVEPDSLNAYLARHRGFTSRGGEMRCAYRTLGQQSTRVFVWALCLELIAQGDSLVAGSGMSLPAAFQVELIAGKARVVGVETPQDGDRYGPSTREIFPASAWPEIFGGNRNDRAASLEAQLRMEASRRLGLREPDVNAKVER